MKNELRQFWLFCNVKVYVGTPAKIKLTKNSFIESWAFQLAILTVLLFRRDRHYDLERHLWKITSTTGLQLGRNGIKKLIKMNNVSNTAQMCWEPCSEGMYTYIYCILLFLIWIGMLRFLLDPSDASICTYRQFSVRLHTRWRYYVTVSPNIFGRILLHTSEMLCGRVQTKCNLQLS